MTISFSDPHPGDTCEGMTPAGAAPLVRRWLEQHGRSVAFSLVRFGVASPADRADLQQEVFITAFLALLRGEVVENPRAWLKECARKMASNRRSWIAGSARGWIASWTPRVVERQLRRASG